MNQIKRSIFGDRGMTMVELLVIVAIIAVLSGVSFVAVNSYQRSLGQLERDGIAKQIFVAAQNHLTAARAENYLSVKQFGEEETGDDKIYYCVFPPVTGLDDASVDFTDDNSSILDLMLPFGSIDETVRKNGSYIIRYQKNTGTVLDVFYCSRFGSPAVFNHDLLSGGETYNSVYNLRGDENKSSRRTHVKGSILGWYGGTASEKLASLELSKPSIKVTNKERLYVTITDPNYGKEGASLRLIISGESSKITRYIDVFKASGDSSDLANHKNEYTRELDNITYNTDNNVHFAQLTFHDGKTDALIPGENIIIQAVAYSTQMLAPTEYSNKVTTNSLFADGSTATKVYIDNIAKSYYLNIIRNDKLSANNSIETLNKVRMIHSDKNIDAYISYALVSVFNDLFVSDDVGNINDDLNEPNIISSNIVFSSKSELDNIFDFKISEKAFTIQSEYQKKCTTDEDILKLYNYDKYKV